MKRFRQGAAIAIGILFVISFTGLNTNGQGLKTPGEIMDFAASKMATYKTWAADYSQSISPAHGSQVTMKGQMVQEPPGRIWMQLDMPTRGVNTRMTMIMGQDGIMWSIVTMKLSPVLSLGYVNGHFTILRVPTFTQDPPAQIAKKDMNKVGGGMKSSPAGDFDPVKQLETARARYDFSVIAARDIDGQPMYVLEGSLKQEMLANPEIAKAATVVGKTRLFIGQSDGFVHRLEQYSKSKPNSILIAMESKNLKFNLDVPDSMFVYQPPPGAKVLDTTPTSGTQVNGQ
jgi:outer membrane lipoprotein-sorting protein